MGEHTRISDAEYEVMELIWRAPDGMTAAEVHAALSARKKLAYNTAATFLTRLCAKGLLESEKRGKTNYYRAKISEDAYKRDQTAQFLSDIHHGSKKSLFASLFRDRLDEQKLDELLRLCGEEEET